MRGDRSRRYGKYRVRAALCAMQQSKNGVLRGEGRKLKRRTSLGECSRLNSALRQGVPARR